MPTDPQTSAAGSPFRGESEADRAARLQRERAEKEAIFHEHLRESENPDYRRGISNCVRILMQRRKELSKEIEKK